MLLAPVEAMGGGVPDVRADLLAEIAVDIVTMLHSSRAAVRAAVRAAAAPTSGEQRAVRAALYGDAGVTLHVPNTAPPASTVSMRALPEAPTWTAATPAPSGPGRAAGAFEAQARLHARLTVWLKGLLFRALREEEVECDADGVPRLRGRALSSVPHLLVSYRYLCFFLFFWHWYGMVV